MLLVPWHRPLSSNRPIFRVAFYFLDLHEWADEVTRLTQGSRVHVFASRKLKSPALARRNTPEYSGCVTYHSSRVAREKGCIQVLKG